MTSKKAADLEGPDLKDQGIIMGLDFGTARIGIAVGQRITATATPLGNVNAKDGKPDWLQMDAIVREWKPDLFVVGMPLNMDGSDSEMSGRARKFANRLQGRFNLPYVLVDERLSSFDARQLKVKENSKESIDSLAAKLILESWLQHSGSPGSI